MSDQQPVYRYPGPFAVPPQQPPGRISTRLVVLLLTLLAGLPILVVGGIAVAMVVLTDGSADDALDDVTTDFRDGQVSEDPATCRVAGFQTDGDYEVYASITNRSGVASSYRIDYQLNGPDGTGLGSDHAVIGDVAAGDTEEQVTFNVIGGSVDPSLVGCQVVEVLRVPGSGS